MWILAERLYAVFGIIKQTVKQPDSLLKQKRRHLRFILIVQGIPKMLELI